MDEAFELGPSYQSGGRSTHSLPYIMRASPTHRDEAEKLFWADPETYYIIESPWLLSGGFPADTGNTFSFFPKVQNLEVTFMSERDLIRCNDDDFEIRWDEVRKFWNVLQERFPSVKHVVLNHSHESPERFRDDHSVSIALRALMRTCPQSLDARILIVDDAQSVKNRRAIDGEELMWERPLYQYGADGQWKKLAPYWQRTTILMPLKGFRGPAGLFESERYQGKRLWYQLIAVDVLAIEALDRYHFDEGRSIPFDCPVVDCDAHFDKAGQWMLHSITHDIKQMDWHWVNVLPGEVRSVFDARKKDLAEKRERTNGSVGLHELYNNRGSEERMELEKAMIHQLENDEDWYTGQQDVRESTLYENFEAEMTPWCCEDDTGLLGSANLGISQVQPTQKGGHSSSTLLSPVQTTFFQYESFLLSSTLLGFARAEFILWPARIPVPIFLLDYWPVSAFTGLSGVLYGNYREKKVATAILTERRERIGRDIERIRRDIEGVKGDMEVLEELERILGWWTK
ncbi:hypothetical protein BU24DRAFT_447106 [Aaosphaeria arxii CBS 175.79]|uniref:C2H2-type domain-containing protein n=1 Tax=Aaosphaeria arxii CBS 175.79 TaxID=1450172 RepID=A0A6A5YAC4_9PLEO|nr:uncharacterized protein BU24DRAFT_447106 [Aaosphaeria arxii CBS 175.79]KAF2022299.1 hypothetical protein BU24DRAFT_447106 [Aaosphaeria arxii CBS 175.79]